MTGTDKRFLYQLCDRHVHIHILSLHYRQSGRCSLRAAASFLSLARMSAVGLVNLRAPYRCICSAHGQHGVTLSPCQRWGGGRGGGRGVVRGAGCGVGLCEARRVPGIGTRHGAAPRVPALPACTLIGVIQERARTADRSPLYAGTESASHTSVTV